MKDMVVIQTTPNGDIEFRVIDSRKQQRQRGQGLVEYILVVVLMGLLTLAAIKSLGQSTQSGFNKSSKALDREFNGL